MNGQSCKATPGCDGTIDGGFCNTCGMEPAEVTAANAPVAAGGAPTSTLAGANNTGTSRTTYSTSISGRTGSRRGSKGSRSTGASRRQLGLGLVAVPATTSVDPMTIVMKVPEVPPNKRFCGSCSNPLTTREKGFCNKCGAPYNFKPALKAGDRVAGQYEVIGPLAFGGMGWIYLGKDVTLNRVVVLKGLLNKDDPALAAAAVAERQFLAEVKHPNVVNVYTFVQHGSAGYTVMEFVGGKTLKSMRKERGPLPVAEVLAYMHRTLGAFAYFHNKGLVYCDFKPDNVMLEDDDVKVIDLGGVRRIVDTDGDIYGTQGYAAPEVAADGPSIPSDIFTIGRTIAVLVTDFKGYQGKYEFTLPTPAEEPLYAKHESLYRLLLKATHKDPNMRFQSCDEFANELLGVLRETVAAETGAGKPFESASFAPDVMSMRDADELKVEAADSSLIPALKMDPADAATQYLLANLGTNDPKRQTAALENAIQAFPQSEEAHLALARNHIQLGNFEEAEKLLAAVEKIDPYEWRVIWYRGLSLLAQNKASEALTAFETCYSEVPGEVPPKLALAMCHELTGNFDRAVALYEVCSKTDPNNATAVFGLARVLASQGKRGDAVTVFGRINQASSLYPVAQKTLARLLISTKQGQPKVEDLAAASKAIEALTTLEGKERFTLVREVMGTALNLLTTGGIKPVPTVVLLGQALDDSPVRAGYENALRNLARLTVDPKEKILLIDEANRVRPVTVF